MSWESRHLDTMTIPVIELSRALLSSCLTLGTILETCRLKKANLKMSENVQDVRKTWMMRNTLEEEMTSHVTNGDFHTKYRLFKHCFFKENVSNL